jgi:hypothetical protein
MAGSMKIGAEFESADDVGTDSNQVHDQSNFNISLSETTDGGRLFQLALKLLMKVLYLLMMITQLN